MINLDFFVVLKKRIVKNIHVEPKRVRAEYCVKQFSGQTASYEFVYSYDTPYFNRKGAEDTNLATIMPAQVALNYGLFVETIEFDGLFDKADRNFFYKKKKLKCPDA
jgi:hypothetical protein